MHKALREGSLKVGKARRPANYINIILLSGEKHEV